MDIRFQLCSGAQAMATPLFSTSARVQPALYSPTGSFRSTNVRKFSSRIQITKIQEICWRIGSARDDYGEDWRRQHTDLRMQIQKLRVGLLQARIKDEVVLGELETLVAAFVAGFVRRDKESGGVEPGSEASDSCLSGQQWNEPLTECSTAELEGVDVLDETAVAVEIRKLQGEELQTTEGLSTLRRLKKLNVHDYVHNALRVSYMRSWLQTRGVVE